MDQPRAPRGNTAPNRRGSSQSSSQVPSHNAADIVLTAPEPEIPPQLTRGTTETGSAVLPQLSILDLRAVAADIKDTLAAAIAELRIDLRSLADRVSSTEQITDEHEV